jgi:hypothetical protein
LSWSKQEKALAAHPQKQFGLVVANIQPMSKTVGNWGNKQSIALQKGFKEKG